MSKYTVEKTRFGLYLSSRPDGTPLVTSLTEELCRAATESYLHGLEHGFSSIPDSVSYSGTVGGKL